jgi:hypothetical protein
LTVQDELTPQQVARVSRLTHTLMDAYISTGDMVSVREDGARLSLRAYHNRENLRMPQTMDDLRLSARFLSQWSLGLNADVAPTTHKDKTP